VATGLWRDAAEAVATLASPTAIEPRCDASRRTEARAEWLRALDRVRGSRSG